MSALDSSALRAVADAVPGLPVNDEGPVFGAPWEAQAFAMAVALQQRGLFTWKEWAVTLGEAIKEAQRQGDPDTGATYYRHWLAALEHVVARKGLTDGRTLARYQVGWSHAASRTPHGTPIELRPDDLPPER
jgi:nitrile hydratase accessory protein